MPASIGVNLRVTGHCRQGGRKYMEDFFSVAYQQTEDEKDLEYAFFGIYDGHGGAEAAAFAKEHLMESIIKHKNFWSDYDEDVLRAIKDGYIATHYAMWKEQEKWPRTASGLPSTAGTTASVAFIRRGKIYIGHVGDSGITLGYQEPGCSEWKAKPLTRDHKPENAEEMTRIEQCGGKVVAKSGVPRVVWNRPKIGHQGPVRRSTPIDEIPFLAVARSLGDLWSYNSQINQFIVSPDPDCSVLKIDTNVHRCLIFGTDGLYNMLSPSMAVHIVQQAERHNENAALSDATYKTWLNPSKLLVEKALERWYATKMRADNTSVVTLMLDPPGPPRAQVLKDRKKNLPERGLKIMTRFDGSNPQEGDCNACDGATSEEPTQSIPLPASETAPQTVPVPPPMPETFLQPVDNNNKEEKSECAPNAPESAPVSSSDLISNFPLKERNFLPKPRESTSLDPCEPPPRPSVTPDDGKENLEAPKDDTIQCNEISSSNIDVDGSCEEDEASESGKHNLRSTKKTKSEVKGKGGEDEPVKSSPSEVGDGVKGNKRKIEPEQSVSQPRKSMRIDLNQKKATEAVEERKKASEAEPNQKKPTEPDVPNQRKPKLSIAQKILRSKPASIKKKLIVKKPLTKKKIQMVLETVRKTALPRKLPISKKVSKKGAKEEKKSPNKIVKVKGSISASKVGRLKSHISKNKCLGKSKVKEKPTKKNNVKKAVEKKKSVAAVGRAPREKTGLEKEVGKKSSSNVPVSGRRSKTASTSKIVEVASGAPANKSPATKAKPKKGVSVKVTALRKRIQKKTENLQKSSARPKAK